MTFRLNPFRRIDTSSNTTIGLKTVWYDISSKKDLRILDVMSHLFIFCLFSLFLQYLDDLPVVRHIDVTTSLKWKKCSSILATGTP